MKLQQRRQQGLILAGVAAENLKRDFAVSRVVVFGSVLSNQAFHATSELDLAVWDLPPNRYLSAVAQLLNFSGFSIDLLPAETATP
jgi:predicted nucleotidyltransferase